MNASNTMKRLLWLAMAVLLAAPVWADDSGSPHIMIDAKGKPDNGQCSFCHEDDLTLSRSKEETCTLCHATTVHAGAVEHMAVPAANVRGLLGEPGKGKVEWPLTDQGQIYCGTCHLFHDPRVMDDAWLTTMRPPNTSPVAVAIRAAVTQQANTQIETSGERKAKVELSTTPTRALRGAVDDGTLCRHCHARGPE